MADITLGLKRYYKAADGSEVPYVRMDGAGGVTETLTATAIVAGAAAVPVIAANANRKTLDLINTGTGTIYFGITSAVNASTGWPMAPAGSANDQGGSYQWSLGHAPPGALYVFSTAGSTVIVKEGV